MVADIISISWVHLNFYDYRRACTDIGLISVKTCIVHVSLKLNSAVVSPLGDSGALFLQMVLLYRLSMYNFVDELLPDQWPDCEYMPSEDLQIKLSEVVSGETAPRLHFMINAVYLM
jgi:hypothetical protein